MTVLTLGVLRRSPRKYLVRIPVSGPSGEQVPSKKAGGRVRGEALRSIFSWSYAQG